MDARYKPAPESAPATQGFLPQIKQKILGLLTHHITANTVILSFGRGLASGLGLLIGIIVARALGPAGFGMFSVAIAVFDIAVVAAEMGIGTSLVRFVPRFTQSDESRARYYLKVGFWLLLISSTAVVIVGLLCSRFISVRLYHKPELVTPIRLGILAVFSGICWNYYLSMLHAREMFQRYSVMSIIIGLLKLALLGAFFYTIGLTVTSVLLLWIITPWIGFAIGYFATPTHLRKPEGNFKQTATDLLKFSRWIFLVDVSIMIFSRVDLLVLGRYVSDEMLGYYSIAAYYMIYVFTILISSFMNVLLPHVAKFDHIQQIRSYVKKILKITSACSILLISVLFLVGPAVHLALGTAYDPAIRIFQIMFWGVIFNFIVEPVYLIAYPANKPQILSAVCLIKLAIAIPANLWLVPRMGVNGAATASVITHVLGGTIALIIIYHLIYKRPTLETAGGKA